MLLECPCCYSLKYYYIECRYHAIHKDIYEWFDIDFDKFGRTSTPQQTEIAQAIFLKLYEKDRLRENTMIQVWFLNTTVAVNFVLGSNDKVLRALHFFELEK